ncbi:MAG: hypothetical protein HYV20_02510 [Gemmatimonadetes bacterium]|nr:hypothetical protein [Gemmatimonadota bacterium]
MDTEQRFVGLGGARDDNTGREFWEHGLRAARDRVVMDFERRYLTWLVSRTGGNMSRAAQIGRVDRTTLYRLMEKHGLRRETILSSST